MRPTRFVYGLTLASVLSVVLSQSLQVLEGQQTDDRIPSLLEPGEAMTVLGTSPLTGHVTFAASQGRGVLLGIPERASAAERAFAFIDGYGRRFGAADSSQVQLQRASGVDAQGFEHVRFQQVHQGVPVTAAELTVHLKGSRVMVVNGHLVDDLPSTVSPAVLAEAAQDTARALIDKNKRPETALSAQYSQPRLEVFNRGFLEGRSAPSRLAWFVEASGLDLREYIWIDASTGALLLNFSQLAHAKSRSVYTANEGPVLPGTLLRTEGGPATGDLDANLAYDYAGNTYDYYLANHGRDSYNNAGAPLISTVHYCDPNQPCPMENAFWNGTQMVYGTTFSRADDVVGHELTHAVTEYSANLFYYMQSGALNESFSDIFGETIDLTNGLGNDAPAVRWRMGEEIGAIRDMMTPTLFNDPGKVSDPQFWCDPRDGGGVHSNSGVPNHAYALMTDGGTYNGRTITGIGLTKAAKVQYRALTTYLTSGSGFGDNYLALNQACRDLTGSSGITAADCGQVNSALLAVEMPNQWNCSGATAPPAFCPVPGTAPVTTFFDSFEAASPAWTTTSNLGSAIWGVVTGFATAGVHSAYGTNQFTLADGTIAMGAGVAIPAGGRLLFDHAFEFEPAFDGGVLEYSNNNGATWNDAAGFVDGGQAYNATLLSGTGNPIGGRQAFSDTSFGYTATRLNLASMAGQSVRFRFRTGTDVSVGGLGWLVDNVRIYSCAVAPQPPPAPTGLVAAPGSPLRVNLSWNASAGATSYNIRRRTSGGPLTLIQSGVTTTTHADTTVVLGTTYSYVVSAVNLGGESPNSNEVSITAVPRVSDGDLDGDNKMEITLYRPSSGFWNILKSSTNFTGSAAFQWGVSTDVPAPGDYDGDGKMDPTVYRPSIGTWYILRSSTNFTSYAAYQWGVSTDVPAPGDYDGDGKTDVAVYRPSDGVWYILKSSTNFTNYVAYQWGVSTDVLAPGDYDGDGKTDPSVYRPGTGTWYILKSSTNFTSYAAYQWGVSTDRPVPGDYDGDGKTDPTAYRPSTGTWYILKSSTNFTNYAAYQWGVSTDITVPGDYDGDGTTDLTVYRPSAGTWYILKSSTNFTNYAAYQWGVSTDVPVFKRP